MSGPLSLAGAPGAAGGDGAAGAVVRLPQRRRTPSWAVGDPVADLAERLAAPCASAVHADEIAALLESEGLTDEQITERYGHGDLFSLAAALFALVPRAHPEPEPAADPWRTDPWRCVLRGLTFALPGVAYVLAGRWAGGPGGPFGVSAAVAGWAAAALWSWGWNQGLAHRAGLLLLAQRPRAAVRCLLTGGAAGTALAAVAALAVTGPAAALSAPAFALGQALYMAAATVLLVLGRERSLLYVLGPLTAAAVCGAAGLPSPAVAAILTATVAAATATAVATAVRSAAAAPAEEAAQTPRVPVLRSVPQALGGLAAGGLVVAAALAGEFVAALTVSMGVAEWLLFRFRSRCLAALRRTGVDERLLARSWRVLARCLGGYAATLAALAGVESALLPGAAAWDAGHLGVLLALGCTLWLALLLQSCGRPWTAAAVLSAATTTAVPLLAAHAGPPGAVIGLTGAGAAAVLLAATATVTARVTTHR